MRWQRPGLATLVAIPVAVIVLLYLLVQCDVSLALRDTTPAVQGVGP